LGLVCFRGLLEEQKKKDGCAMVLFFNLMPMVDDALGGQIVMR